MITFEKQLQNKNESEYSWGSRYTKSNKEHIYSRGDVLRVDRKYDYNKVCILGHVKRTNKNGGGMGHGYLLKGSNNVTPKINSGLWIFFMSENDIKNKKYTLSLSARLKQL